MARGGRKAGLRSLPVMADLRTTVIALAAAALLGATGAMAWPARPATLLPDLPLIVGPPPRSGVLAVVYSGDGGWAALDRALARRLTDRGAGVVGVDCLRYFWRRRTAAGASADLARVVRTYRAAWRSRTVVLAGFSFGADALPILWRDLPADVRAAVAEVVLIGPERTAELKVRPLRGLDMSPRDALPVTPALAAMGAPVTCIYGVQDRAALCPRLSPGVARTVRLAGSHHFGGHYGALGSVVASAMAPAEAAPYARFPSEWRPAGATLSAED